MTVLKFSISKIFTVNYIIFSIYIKCTILPIKFTYSCHLRQKKLKMFQWSFPKQSFNIMAPEWYDYKILRLMHFGIIMVIAKNNCCFIGICTFSLLVMFSEIKSRDIIVIGISGPSPNIVSQPILMVLEIEAFKLYYHKRITWKWRNLRNQYLNNAYCKLWVKHKDYVDKISKIH